MKAIEKAADLIGNQAELARAIGVTPQAVNQWCNGHRPVPPRLALAVERVTESRVTRYELRPDVFGSALAA